MNIPGLEDLMKQAQAFSQQMARMKEELARETVQGSAGGGMVLATANGRGAIVDIKIESEVVNSEDIEMLQDLVIAAVNQAIGKARELAANKARSLTGGMSIPGLENLLT
jgi:DNA-binding YbaB/EbfC family protein